MILFPRTCVVFFAPEGTHKTRHEKLVLLAMLTSQNFRALLTLPTKTQQLLSAPPDLLKLLRVLGKQSKTEICIVAERARRATTLKIGLD